MDNNTWKVYCYTGENNKKYIGITGYSLFQRAGKDGINYIKDDFAFGRAIKKYGFNFFTPEILADKLTFEEACALEQYYIKLYDTYKSGYNSTLGGEGHIKYDKERILSLWNENKNIKEIEQIIGCDKSTIQKVLNSYGISGMDRIKRQAGKYHLQEVHKYDLEGNYLESYISYSEAGRQNNIPHINIIKCIQGKRQTAGGFQWSIIKKDSLPVYQRNLGNHKKIYQYDLNKNLIKEYESVAEAARITGFSKEYLATTAKKQKKAYNFFWSYEKINTNTIQ